MHMKNIFKYNYLGDVYFTYMKYLLLFFGRGNDGLQLVKT